MRQTTEKTKSPVKNNKIAFYASTPTEYTDRDGEIKTRWTNVGVAFKTTAGIMVSLDALPVSGKIYLAPPKED